MLSSLFLNAFILYPVEEGTDSVAPNDNFQADFKHRSHSSSSLVEETGKKLSKIFHVGRRHSASAQQTVKSLRSSTISNEVKYGEVSFITELVTLEYKPLTDFICTSSSLLHAIDVPKIIKGCDSPCSKSPSSEYRESKYLSKYLYKVRRQNLDCIETVELQFSMLDSRQISTLAWPAHVLFLQSVGDITDTNNQVDGGTTTSTEFVGDRTNLASRYYSAGNDDDVSYSIFSNARDCYLYFSISQFSSLTITIQSIQRCEETLRISYRQVSGRVIMNAHHLILRMLLFADQKFCSTISILGCYHNNPNLSRYLLVHLPDASYATSAPK